MDPRSTGEVVASLIVNTQAMVAKEVELLGLEIKRMVARKAAAIGLLVVGALAGVGVLLLGAVTAAIALTDVFEAAWMAWGVVTLATALLALLLVGVAAGILSRGWSPTAGRRDATTTADWLRALSAELTGTADGTRDATSEPREGER